MKNKPDHEDKKPNSQENYMINGMCFGMLAGSAAMSILSSFGHVALGSMCISFGMLIGLVVGVSIKKP